MFGSLGKFYNKYTILVMYHIYTNFSAWFGVDCNCVASLRSRMPQIIIFTNKHPWFTVGAVLASYLLLPTRTEGATSWGRIPEARRSLADGWVSKWGLAAPSPTRMDKMPLGDPVWEEWRERSGSHQKWPWFAPLGWASDFGRASCI
jgi:hypothetical protein